MGVLAERASILLLSGLQIQGSMVTISTADPDSAGTKITVDTRRYATKDNPSRTSSSVTTLYSAGGNNRSTPFRWKGRRNVTPLVVVRVVMEWDQLSERGPELTAKPSATLMRFCRSVRTARHLQVDLIGCIGGDLHRQRADFLRLRRQYAELLAPKCGLQLHNVGEIFGAC